ncbi:kinesin-like protein KIF6 [Lingula anatina]|uniref:Kinesin-like protein KIF6 n=1 Tax=Lingula anatina TaxID=7574 RepID=A0A1S3I1P3_LINAN|nr:kinesin-like protein KIF6 [Lingula anatina]|eukprot:XP_013391269.1 kinesin-like protein KIF6 [Lingula anatina]
MVKQTIQIFLRVKPTRAKTGPYEIDEDDGGNPRITFTVPRDLAGGFINNKKEQYKFRFQRLFDQPTKQEEVFENVARPVIDNVLEGYNGTIFAYGQTGSGKTFTITGGAERYADRGIIPRSLSYIFEQFEKNPGFEHSTHISYLEIYNENGYDLLDPKHEVAKLEDLPKVSLMEDSDQNVHLKNLSTHTASNEEEALNLLFLGDTNRMIAETPMNQASTRSHCVFTIHITSREVGSATIRRSKLHLVDLAGSERVSKSGVNGLLLTEAKYINLSLHYLEQVIVALSEKSRQHIPYRNSMLTSVLRDSLGGNCMTTMIATCSVERKNIDESISTCRFAQRVALIKNEALLNEELDPKLMIIKLKKEIGQLKEELAMVTGETRTDDLTEEELERCQQAVQSYLQDTDPEGILDIGADMRKIQRCYRIMKQIISEKPQRSPQEEEIEPADQFSAPSPPPTERPESRAPADSRQLKKLNDIIKQRDNEINILVNMLKKEKKRAADAISQLESLGHRPATALTAPDGDRIVNGVASRLAKHRPGSENDALPDKHSKRPPSGHRRRERDPPQLDEKDEKRKAKILGDLSVGRQEAFEIYRRDYEHNQTIEDNKSTLKARYAEAKSLGELVNKSRKQINHIKSQIEHHRMTQAMQGLADPNNSEPDDIEKELRIAIEEEKHNGAVVFNIESISTCRFAQRVALIKNEALLNEELDPKLMIIKLKKEIGQLKEELAMVTGETRTDDLTEEELERCQQAVQSYLQDTDPEGILDIGADMRKIQRCYRIMKQIISEKPQRSPQEEEIEPADQFSAPSPPPTDRPESRAPADSRQLKKLNDIIKQRDNEINILVNMLKKEKKRAADAISQLESLGHRPATALTAPDGDRIVNGVASRLAKHRPGSENDALPDKYSKRPPSGHRRRERDPPQLDEKDEKRKAKILGDLSVGRQEAFEIYRRDYEHNQTIEDNKSTLKARYAEAKSLGELVNKSRKQINHIKSQIEHHRMTQAMQGLADPNNSEPDDIEKELRIAIEEEKHKYKETFNRLRVLKTEIEHLQHLLEKSKVKLLKDFELWWTEQSAIAESQQQNVHSKGHKTAWKTPPLSPLKQSASGSSITTQGSQFSEPQGPGRPPHPGSLRHSGVGTTYIKSTNTMNKESSGYHTEVSGTNHQQSWRVGSEATKPPLQLTGDAQADADIMAFMRARQNLLKKAQQGNR